ncbi:MAG: hypothetical protein M0R03_03570 [Novosphingobium sp.]|nr:hypothetical protein [Novosphingobium sp.]
MTDWKITHIIEILNDETYIVKEEGREFSLSVKKASIHNAMEDQKNKGFLVLGFHTNKFFLIPASNVKVIEEVKPKKIPTQGKLTLRGFLVEGETIKLWNWNPQEDITVFELSLLLPHLLTSGSKVPIKKVDLDNIVFNWEKHFTFQEVPMAVTNSKEYKEMVANIR